MTTYRQGDVVLVPVPFTDQTSSKRRPALVISANWYNRERDDVLVTPITSTVRKPLDREEFLVRDTEYQRAGLYKESVVKCGLIFAVHTDLIFRKLGLLLAGSSKQIYEKVIDVLSGS